MCLWLHVYAYMTIDMAIHMGQYYCSISIQYVPLSVHCVCALVWFQSCWIDEEIVMCKQQAIYEHNSPDTHSAKWESHPQMYSLCN